MLVSNYERKIFLLYFAPLFHSSFYVTLRHNGCSFLFENEANRHEYLSSAFEFVQEGNISISHLTFRPKKKKKEASHPLLNHLQEFYLVSRQQSQIQIGHSLEMNQVIIYRNTKLLYKQVGLEYLTIELNQIVQAKSIWIEFESD